MKEVKGVFDDLSVVEDLSSFIGVMFILVLVFFIIHLILRWQNERYKRLHGYYDNDDYVPTQEELEAYAKWDAEWEKEMKARKEKRRHFGSNKHQKNKKR